MNIFTKTQIEDTKVATLKQMQVAQDIMISNYPNHDYSEYGKYMYEIEDAETIEDIVDLLHKWSTKMTEMQNNLKKVAQ